MLISKSEKVCRCCLKEGDGYQIYETLIGDSTIKDIFNKFSPFKIEYGDPFPKIFCTECVSILLNFYDYINTFEESTNQLRSYLEADPVCYNPDQDSNEKCEFNNGTQILFDHDYYDTKTENYEVKTENLIEINDTKNDSECLEQTYILPNKVVLELTKHLKELSSKAESESEEIYINDKEIRTGTKIDSINDTTQNTSSGCEDNEHEPEKKFRKRCAKSISKTKNVLKVRKGSTICEVCGKTFSRTSNLWQHLRNHYPKSNRSVCEICGKTYPRENLRKHAKTHYRQTKFLCDICKRTFWRRDMWKRHVLLHQNQSCILCESCGKGFSDLSKLQVHQEEVHLKTRQYTCHSCSKIFHSKRLLRKHIQRHELRELRFQCDLCGSKYLYSTSLKKHKAVKHSGAPYEWKCNFCGAMRFSPSSRHRHMQECGTNATKTISSLKQRRRKAKHMPTYSCDLCNSNYMSLKTLEKHKLIKHSETSYEWLCSSCGKTYPISSSFKHLKMCSGIEDTETVELVMLEVV